MSTQTEEELKLAEILVTVLDLEDISASDIDPEAALFDASTPNSLGLDSIDALEITLAITKNYGVQIKADDENNHAVFKNLRSLTNHINSKR
ncbi:MAG: acyl carrier protein [Alteromonadaceae bacterium]|nr:MAG: acyl carrier protein [Alteromonadaceae bacterium]